MGMLDGESNDWGQDLTRFQDRIRQEITLPLQTEQIRGLVQSLSDQEKRRFSSILKISFAKQGKKRFPDILFQKEFNSFIKHCSGETAGNYRERLFLAIINVIFPLFENMDDEYITTFIDKQDELIEKHGPWKYYWALYFHSDRNDQLLWESEVHKLRERISDLDKSRKKDGDLNIDNTSHKENQYDHIRTLENKIKREMEIRQSLEKQLDQKDKLIRTKEQQIKKMVEDNRSLEANSQWTIEQQDKQLLMMKDEQEQWDKRKNEREAHILLLEKRWKDSELKWEKAEEALENSKQEIRDLKKKLNDLQIEQTKLQQTPSRIEQLIPQLYRDMEAIHQILVRRSSTDPRTPAVLRNHIRMTLDLIDHLELFVHKEAQESVRESAQEDHDVSLGVAPNSPDKIDGLIETELEKEGPQEIYMGTFYRRDHGGYIQLENGEIFNITESMVFHHDLQHLAEVQCKPVKKDDGMVYYDIELLFQGDDDYSPITQHEGYVQLGEHFTWYCVDMNDPSHRYVLHEKDISVLNPNDGDPCTFNINDGSEIARLSRIHKTYEHGKKSLTKPNVTRTRRNDGGIKSKEKPEPYLYGCRIAIVGGQLKWFDEVVVETGAELVHDNGSSPDRIYADLKNSSALFLLLSANSHRATWGSMEIAKEYGIPHFIIQGSKSNLRKLLWDNRELIKSQN
jgi:hypothetical protein